MNSEQEIRTLNGAEAHPGEKGAGSAAVPAVKTLRSGVFAYPRIKNVFDRTAAFFALVILSPAIAVITLTIRLDSPGNPVFSQERVGKDGRRFNFYKFRSMYLDHDDSEYYRLIKNYVQGEDVSQPSPEGAFGTRDRRVTRIGRFLRKTNLDELPQLLNILKGDMSFVGPRPMIPFMVEMYSDRHKKCLEARPGLAGLWQASGRKDLTFEEMIDLDLDYIKSQSFSLDVKIILLTARAVLRGEGS